jgi:hypothetical protein
MPPRGRRAGAAPPASRAGRPTEGMGDRAAQVIKKHQDAITLPGALEVRERTHEYRAEMMIATERDPLYVAWMNVQFLAGLGDTRAQFWVEMIKLGHRNPHVLIPGTSVATGISKSNQLE